MVNGNWRPVESVPRNETDVLLLLKDRRMVVAAHIPEMFAMEDCLDFVSFDGPEYPIESVVGWMPLPDLPGEGE